MVVDLRPLSDPSPPGAIPVGPIPQAAIPVEQTARVGVWIPGNIIVARPVAHERTINGMQRSVGKTGSNATVRRSVVPFHAIRALFNRNKSGASRTDSFALLGQ